MQDKIINIDGKDVRFRATGSTPRLYRTIIGKDIFSDMQKLSDVKEGEQMSPEAMTVFENIAYIMARHGAIADGKEKEFPQKIDEWLDGFDLMGFYNILPQILELWAADVEQKSTSKKK